MLVLRNNGVNALVPQQQNAIDRFFDEVFSDLDLFGGPSPGTNVYEDAGNLVYEVELPGVKRDQVKVRLDENDLLIQTEVLQDKNVDKDRYLSVGRRYGKFERRYRLPENVALENAKKVVATLENGLLKVSLPLKKSLKPQTVDIKVS